MQRSLTHTDRIVYVLIALLLLVWLFGIDGGLSR